MTDFWLLLHYFFVWGLMGSLGCGLSDRRARRHVLINPGPVPVPARGDHLHQSTNQKLVQI